MHVAYKRSSSIGRVVTVQYEDSNDIPRLVILALWDMLGNESKIFDIGCPDEWEPTDEMKILSNGGMTGENNGNGTYTVTFVGSIEMTRTFMKLRGNNFESP
jgi:hypothetical protein